MTEKCRECGEDLRDNARFCVGCGASVPRGAEAPADRTAPPADAPSVTLQPPPAPPYPSAPAPARVTAGPGLSQGAKTAIAVGICALVVGSVVAISAGSGSNRPAPGGSGGSGAFAGGATSSRTLVTETIPAPATETTSATPTDARTLLQRQVEQDRSSVEQLVGSWLPQLSAKKPGTLPNGTTHDYDTIWADFLANRQLHPDALLLWSGDYSSFRYADFWITVVPQQFSDGASANAWCDSYEIPKDDCYAKRLMHTGGYAGNTMLRK
ncbi:MULTISPECIES: zinc ribbon domain-containing protein [unclassified Amycolatopsis]|uniref:zinc ribbon domain-containing protein n=1 Tax=unclassified Amycolatopsis TaxID=2618356 RepID=UPI0028746C08|nr:MULTISPECIES: zinc ribbon domain-containing protein [unclassified Amycolatopsis]MDS0133213.1 zinc ribbon domain-containing protein [Amycolatopsis sp. 505]MDS0146443.1 zinc ribbon domain-containing protein [Amycolatopsis sp. CM201R]